MKENKKVSFSLPPDVHDKAVEAAQSLGLSLSAWLKFVVGGAVKRWKPPVEKQVQAQKDAES